MYLSILFLVDNHHFYFRAITNSTAKIFLIKLHISPWLSLFWYPTFFLFIALITSWHIYTFAVCLFLIFLPGECKFCEYRDFVLISDISLEPRMISDYSKYSTKMEQVSECLTVWLCKSWCRSLAKYSSYPHILLTFSFEITLGFRKITK